jgi:CDP-diglyceride synthetase
VHLAFDIFQGMGIAAAVGIRPFLPALAAGALAAGGVEIHFHGTDFSFLQGAPFLIGVAVAGVAVLGAETRLRRQASQARATAMLIAAVGLVLGALFFAGSLARGHYADWPGVIGGVVCAALAAVATAPLLGRVSARLGAQDAAAIPFYAEGVAVLAAVLSVVAPPVGVILVLLTAWLLAAGRRREAQKFAGLRILR